MTPLSKIEKELCHEIHHRHLDSWNCHQIEQHILKKLKIVKEGKNNTADTKQRTDGQK